MKCGGESPMDGESYGKTLLMNKPEYPGMDEGSK